MVRDADDDAPATQVLSMPSAMPPMMTVAGPVNAWSASSLVGAYSSLVEYSVHLPISQPATRPDDDAQPHRSQRGPRHEPVGRAERRDDDQDRARH